MSEMVERVAKAMKECREPSYTESPWNVLARAAIAEMREPTEKMFQSARYSAVEQDIEGVWQDMIDEALK